jgi:hypothetical protein
VRRSAGHSPLAFVVLLTLAAALPLPAQETAGGPSAALLDALGAACRQQTADFVRFLPEESAEAYRNLSRIQQQELMHRIVAVREPGKPLRSTSSENLPVFRCSSPAETTEMRLGHDRTRGNLSFIPVRLPSGRATEFGMVHESTGWRLLSLGLLILDVPQLTQEWAAQETVTRELRTVAALHQIAAAAETYRRGFGVLPETLAQLGPAPKEGASPDAANLIDGELAGGAKDNYSFRYRVLSASRVGVQYEIIATPTQYGPGGKRSFYLNNDGILRGADKNGDVAGPDDPRLDERLREEP